MFAFVMDTRRCDAAVTPARRADLVVVESTYLEVAAVFADGAAARNSASFPVPAATR